MASPREQFVVDAKGRKTGVIVPFRRYQKVIEDLRDLAIAAERRDEKPIPLAEMKRRLKKDDIIGSCFKAVCREGPSFLAKGNG